MAGSDGGGFVTPVLIDGYPVMEEKSETPNQSDSILSAILAAYSCIREEMNSRVGTQSTVLGWLLTLTGAFVGAFLTMNAPGSQESLLISGLYDPTSKAYAVVGLLCIGYTVAVELLIAFWIYQLFHIFRYAKEIVRMDKALRTTLGLKDTDNLLDWSIDLPPVDGSLAKQPDIVPRSVHLSLRITACLQPISLYVLSTIGLSVLTMFSIAAIRKMGCSDGIRLPILCFATIAVALTATLCALAFMHFALVKWVAGKSWFPWYRLSTANGESKKTSHHKGDSHDSVGSHK